MYRSIAVSILLLSILSCSGGSGSTGKKPDRGTPVFRPRKAARTALLTDARVLGSSALMFYHKGQYKAAVKEYRKAINKLILIDNYIEIGKIRINLTLIYIKLKSWKMADSTIQSAISVFRKHNLYPFLARSIAMQGRIHEARKEYDRALSLYKKALNLLQKYRGPSAYMAEQLGNVAFANFKLKKFSRAFRFFKASASINNRIRNYSALAQDFTYLGKCQLALKKYKDALQYFKNALTADRVTENPSGIALSHRHIAACYSSLGKPLQAIEHYNRAIRINSVLKNTRRIVADLKSLISIHREQKNSKKVRELTLFYNRLRKKVR